MNSGKHSSYPAGPLRLSIGILAWNEESGIARTIESLLEQSVFENVPDGVESIQVLCIPNGCTDRTAEVAELAFQDARRRSASLGISISFSVLEVSVPGKTNAWNYFVHNASDPNADMMILMDADVHFHGRDTLAGLICKLRDSKDTLVSTARMIKDFELKPKRSLMERLSMVASRLQTNNQSTISGGLYCARAAVLRRIRMPLGLLVEDGFLRAMILTNGFKAKEDTSLVQRVSGTGLVHEAHAGIAALFYHEKRIILGSFINSLLFKSLSALPPDVDPGEWVRHRNEEDPLWVSRLVQDHVRDTRWWALGNKALLRRFRGLKKRSLPNRLVWFLVACGVSLVELPIYLAANYQLRKNWENAW